MPSKKGIEKDDNSSSSDDEENKEEAKKKTVMKSNVMADIDANKDERPGGGGKQQFNFDDQMKSTKSCMHSLEQLRSQHEQMLNGLQQSKQLQQDEAESNAKYKAIELSKQRIESGLADAQFMIQANAYIKQLESERRLLQAQVKRLIQENSWLREELNAAHQKSQENDQGDKAPTVRNTQILKPASNPPFEPEDDMEVMKSTRGIRGPLSMESEGLAKGSAKLGSKVTSQKSEPGGGATEGIPGSGVSGAKSAAGSLGAPIEEGSEDFESGSGEVSGPIGEKSQLSTKSGGNGTNSGMSSDQGSNSLGGSSTKEQSGFGGSENENSKSGEQSENQTGFTAGSTVKGHTGFAKTTEGKSGLSSKTGKSTKGQSEFNVEDSAKGPSSFKGSSTKGGTGISKSKGGSTRTGLSGVDDDGEGSEDDGQFTQGEKPENDENYANESNEGQDLSEDETSKTYSTGSLGKEKDSTSFS